MHAASGGTTHPLNTAHSIHACVSAARTQHTLAHRSGRTHIPCVLSLLRVRAQDLGGEHLSDLTGDTGKQGGGAATPGSAGYDGGGASAYPAEESGKVAPLASTLHLEGRLFPALVLNLA